MPFAKDAVAGVIAIETSSGGVMVRLVLAEILPNFASIVVVPTDIPITSKDTPARLVDFEILSSVEIQSSESPILRVLPSEYVPVAL